MNKIFIFLITILLVIGGFFYFYNGEEIIMEEPYIIGEIHSFSENRILVAEDSRGEDYTGSIDDLKGNAIWVTIDEDTLILDEAGESMQLETLIVGTKLEIMTKGMILESYPAKGLAYRIIILEYVTGECFVGGCSGELCTDDPEAISTCEFLPGMECISEGMSCEMVKNECVWILSQEAAECFLRVERAEGEAVRDTRIGYLFKKAKTKLIVD